MKSYFCFNRIFAVVIVLVAVATIFFACSKNNDADPTTNENDNKVLAAAAYEAQVSTLYDDLFDVALEGSQVAGLASNTRLVPQETENLKLNGCYEETLNNATPGVWPKILTLDFGAGCTGADGRTRAGKVILTISNFILLPNATITITLDGYSVNGVGLKGTKEITNLASASGFSYKTKVTGGVISLDTLTFGYASEKTITQTEGAGTPLNTNDDFYSGTGTATLTYPSGAAVTYSVKEPLVKELKCAWIGKGKADVTFEQVTATIDYGAGICDDSATVSIADKVKGVILPK
jgi:hypothetical protein